MNPRRTFVDESGRFWRTLPGLGNVVYLIETPGPRGSARPAQAITHTLTYATTCYGLKEITS